MWYCKIHDSEFTSRPKQMVLLLHKDRAKCTTSFWAERLLPENDLFVQKLFSFFLKKKKKKTTKNLAASWLQIFVYVHIFSTPYPNPQCYCLYVYYTYIFLAATVSAPSLASRIHEWNENKSAHHGCSILLWLGLRRVMPETLKLAEAGRALWGGFKDKALRRPLSPFGQRGLTSLHNAETLWVLAPAVSRPKNPPKTCRVFTDHWWNMSVQSVARMFRNESL